MPQIGWLEILFVVVISILVVGPKDFPIMLKKIGNWIGTFKSYFSEIQNSVTNIDNLMEDDPPSNKDFVKSENKKKDE
jgi:sec-independent protein translocase protein TatB